MTQEERWQKRDEEVMDFMKNNHRNLLKHHLEEKLKHLRVPHIMKLLNLGTVLKFV